MARARNIKPGLFKNEILGVADPMLTLLFEGLWILSDKEGRLEDRPLRIKGELFPYREGLNIDQMLQWLHENGFVLRYSVQGSKYIEVLNFKKHQNPHKNETDSGIPAPEKIGTTSEKIGTTRADSLIPDSLNLIPDSLIPEEKTSMLTHATARPMAEPDENAPKPAKTSIPECPHLEILQLWAEVLPTLPQHLPNQWRGSRADHLRARWREKAVEKKWQTKDEGLTYFRRLFAHVGKSKFLTGQIPTRDPTKRAFVIELEWLVSPGNWAKVLEGKYNEEDANE